MSIRDRLRLGFRRTRGAPAWDDGDAAALVASLAAAAAALDPQPDDPRVAASRAAMLGTFAAATTGIGNVPAGTSEHARHAVDAAPGSRRGGRRSTVMLVATGALLALGVGTVAASAPGGPLYSYRVTSEELFLPDAPVDRSRAQVERLDGRLAEATSAAARGD
ncbi:MAG: hypothetical protein ACYC65_14860, partial [Candidatus Limnocylindrales bacterium]